MAQSAHTGFESVLKRSGDWLTADLANPAHKNSMNGDTEENKTHHFLQASSLAGSNLDAIFALISASMPARKNTPTAEWKMREANHARTTRTTQQAQQTKGRLWNNSKRDNATKLLRDQIATAIHERKPRIRASTQKYGTTCTESRP